MGLEVVDGGIASDRTVKCARVQASSVEPVQRRLINLLALAGASFSFLPADFLSGQHRIHFPPAMT